MKTQRTIPAHIVGRMAIAFSILFIACGQERKMDLESSANLEKEATAPLAQSVNQSNAEAFAPGGEVIRKANYRMQVNDMEKSQEALEQAVSAHRGYVSNASLVSDRHQVENTVTIRVPSESFEALLKEIGKQAVYTHHRNIQSEEVSAEFVDIRSRLKTKQEVEQRYIDILRNKAKTVEEVLKAEEQIRVIREEIEAKTGRLNYLTDQVRYSTIQLEMYQLIPFQPAPEPTEPGFFTQFIEAFQVGWQTLLTILLFAVRVWPLLLIVAAGWWFRRWVFEKRLSVK
jgi:hypothetical protein